MQRLAACSSNKGEKWLYHTGTLGASRHGSDARQSNKRPETFPDAPMTSKIELVEGEVWRFTQAECFYLPMVNLAPSQFSIVAT
ncbi:hypothetical protein [Paraburkholderia sp. SG-MS1]|uniref:hypothetical protein n=1 Tax=Paraburkholderia sp. SG-MS1 TaxID=2023741 RepID=UPI0014480085|nr:hypothetical protein [Paraburkholderia sp. SG-MS1]